MGAAGTTVEFAVLEWMLDRVGFGADGGGVLTHGGSLANLTALLAARAAAAPDAWVDGNPADLALLAPPSAHYSLTRATGILGLGSKCVVPLAVDDLGRIDVARLPEPLEHGRRLMRSSPMRVPPARVSTTTSAASALLSDEHRRLLDGIELADSVIWDAHKLSRTSSLVAAVLTQRHADLDAAFQQEGSYLFHGDQRFDLIGRTVVGTKAEQGLKLFLNLAWRGGRRAG